MIEAGSTSRPNAIFSSASTVAHGKIVAPATFDSRSAPL